MVYDTGVYWILVNRIYDGVHKRDFYQRHTGYNLCRTRPRAAGTEGPALVSAGTSVGSVGLEARAGATAAGRGQSRTGISAGATVTGTGSEVHAGAGIPHCSAIST
jgi:hypothetical protein